MKGRGGEGSGDYICLSSSKECSQGESFDCQNWCPHALILQLHTESLLLNVLQQHSHTANLREGGGGREKERGREQRREGERERRKETEEEKKGERHVEGTRYSRRERGWEVGGRRGDVMLPFHHITARHRDLGIYAI